MASARALTRSEIAQIAIPPAIFTVGAILLTIYLTIHEEPGKSAARMFFTPWALWAVKILGLIWVVNLLRIERRCRRTPA